MAIQLLPPSSARILGSCQALTTPSSLVKELIDNAIDAKATSIDVIISANTLDKIEVRDNGHGIAHEDLDSLGRHGHTSKLKDFEELRTVSSSSLGFRGEALASCVGLGEVTVTTRAEGEPVAFMVNLKSTGGISSQLSVSHPIGTTVCVSNFLSSFPVRRQASLNNASKSISKIRGVLQSYALARLRIRLNLKVIKTGKGNWSYIPRPNGGIKEAVMQVAGKEVASQCIEIVSMCDHIASAVDIINENDAPISRTSNDERQPSRKQPLRMHAFLARPDSNISKLKDGQYASIDSRPVSCTRGSLRKIVSSYKQHIRTFIAKTGNDMPKGIFIYFNITCPIGSYDPNIEPAKDDVLFEDEDAILSVAEKLFKSVYSVNDSSVVEVSNGQPISKPALGQNPVIKSRVKVSQSIDMSGFETPEANYRTRGEQRQDKITHKTLANTTPSDTSETAETFDCEMPSSPPAPEYRGCNSLNPWVNAKLNDPATGNIIHSSSLPTPRPRKQHILQVDDVSPPFFNEPYIKSDTPNNLVGTQIDKGSRSGPTQRLIETWVNKQQGYGINGLARQSHGPAPQQVLDSFEGRSAHDHHTSPQSNEFATARPLPATVPWSPPPTGNRSQLKSSWDFNSPLIRPRKAEITPGVCKNASDSYIPTPLNNALSTPSQKPSRMDIFQLHNGVDAALEFETRKATSTRRLREEAAAVVRLEAKINGAPREEVLMQETMDGALLPDGDSRAYLMRRQKSMTAALNGSLQGPKLKRFKTMLLPLETIPKTLSTSDLAIRMLIDVASVSRTSHILSTFDDYIKSGTRVDGLRMTKAGSRQIEIALNSLMKTPQSYSTSAQHISG